MIRFTTRVFTDLAIWMIGFGLLVGMVFPPLVVLLGVPAQTVLTPGFFLISMVAGCVVGGVNIALARVVVGRRLRLLAARMGKVEANLRLHVDCGEKDEETAEGCRIPVDSEDELGSSARAFNSLVDALSRSRRTEAAVRHFDDMLVSELDLDILAERALAQLLQHTGAMAGAILVEIDGESRVAAVRGIRDADNLVESQYVHQALQSEKRQRVNLPQQLSLDGVLADFRPSEVLVDPILHKRVPLGVVVLGSATGFDAETLTQLDLFNPGLALALNNSLTHARLQRLAALDPLTGIYNRRFGLARLDEEYSRAVRSGSPLGLMMIDVDHFKSMNDRYGHLLGDRFLTHAAHLVRSVLREGDVLMRYGGDELLGILPAASLKDAHAIGERLVRILDQSPLVDGDQIVPATVSVGVSAYPESPAADEEELVRLADRALYAAKEKGRHCVVSGMNSLPWR